MKSEIYLFLGTNLGDKAQNISKAKTLIAEHLGTILEESEILQTKAFGYDSSNDYFNQAVSITTELSPLQLLSKIKEIEVSMGRKLRQSGEPYSDRLIDIDIAFYQNIEFYCENLQIPHRGYFEREFEKKLIDQIRR